MQTKTSEQLSASITKKYRVTLIPGDGTGPEIMQTVQRVVDATGVHIEWEKMDAGEVAQAKYGTPMPKELVESIRKNKVALKGPITTPIGTGFRSVNVALRLELNLYACLRPCKSYEGVRNARPGVDLVVVRENTEDLYTGIEFEPGSPAVQKIAELANTKKILPGSAVTIKHISPQASERIVRFAFDYAIKNKRKKVTAVTKANILKHTDRLFYEAARKVAKDYEGQVEYEERLVDNMCMQLVIKPELYDVMVLPNLYGDIVSDLCAGLIGGLGVAPGANIGDGCALFEAVHGSAPKYKGMNKVNPTALLLSAKMMLEYLGEIQAANKLDKAVASVIKEGKHVTYDLGGTKGTSEMGDAIIEKLNAL